MKHDKGAVLTPCRSSDRAGACGCAGVSSVGCEACSGADQSQILSFSCFWAGVFFYIVGAFFEEICIRYRVFRGLFEFDVSNFAIVPGNMFVR